MAKCILHVGMHKTGTTSIQNSLQALDDGNFYYARMLAKPNHSVTISSIFHIGNKSHVARKLTRNGKMDADQMAAAARPELVASIVAANGRTLVISGEGILRMSREELSLLKAYLVDHGIDDIVVMAYVRAPVAYISSAMQQKLKIGNIRSLRLETCFPDYRDKFEKFDMVFGAGKVKLVKFDPEAFPDRDVVADFCQRTGIPPSSISPVRMNESITRLAAQLRFQYTSHADTEDLPPLKGAVSRGLLERCRGIDPTPFRMAPSVVRPFAARIQPDVEWMEKRLGQPLAEPQLVDSPTDVRSEDDLMVPIPGINEKLRDVLAEAGVEVAEGETDNTWMLFARLARLGSRKSNDNGKDAKPQRMAKKRKASQLDPDGKANLKSRRNAPQHIGQAGDHRVLRKAERRDARAAKVDRGRGRRAEQASGAMTQEERRRKRDARIMVLAQAIAAAGVSNSIAATSPLLANPGNLGLASGASDLQQDRGAGKRPRQGRGMGPGQGRGPGGGANADGRPAGGAGLKGAAAPPSNRAPNAVLQLPRANARPDAAGTRMRKASTPITTAPKPLINIDKNLAVLWSPKSACTTVYVWFSHLSGFAGDVKDYAAWPHRHRLEQYNKSDLYFDSAANGMENAKLLRIIRDPYSRAVSIYRHALLTMFADKAMDEYSNGTITAVDGYSFQTFLDMAATLNMMSVDIHFRPQVHRYESKRKADRVINISKQDLFTELNAFEAEIGIPKTNFDDLNWLHSLESKRKAKQEPMAGEALDAVAFSRHQLNKLGQFPSYNQLLTPAAREKIEVIYKSDFDAYRDFL